MNGATFRLLRTTMGLEIGAVAAELDINRRTIERWESGKNPLPEFAQIWIEERWQAFLDEVGDYLAPLEDLPEGTQVDVATYGSTESLRRAGSDRSLGEVEAMNSGIAICLGLMDLAPSASLVPVEE
ncbi:helix-turn-helix transcriptional regulator [Trueperella pyogenes]|uniref:helix-turn-helix domain-containing protein n=1 Tax=Trueperella pyogenes TaxID=1661 RepID=UPI00312B4CCA